MRWGEAAWWVVGMLAVFVVGAALVSSLATSLGERFVARACAAVPDRGLHARDGRVVARTAGRGCGAGGDSGRALLADGRGEVAPLVRPASPAVVVLPGPRGSIRLTWRNARHLEMESSSCPATSRREWAWRGVRVSYRAACEAMTVSAGVRAEQR